MQTVLIVDRETDFLDWCKSQVEAEGRRVIITDSAEKAFQIFCLENPEVVIAEKPEKNPAPMGDPSGGMDF